MTFYASSKEYAELYKKLDNVGGGEDVTIKITSSGTSTATSTLSYEDALIIAKKNAYNIALSNADDNANVINQCYTIINQNNQNSFSSNNIISDNIKAKTLELSENISSSNSINTNSLTVNGNITLSTLFTKPILGQLGYINNLSTSFIEKNLENRKSVILSKITITPGVWQIFYKFKYYSSSSTPDDYKGGIYTYIYGLTDNNTLCTSLNYDGYLSNQFSYSAGSAGFYIGPQPGFVSDKENLVRSITNTTTYYLQFGIDGPSNVLYAIATSLYALRIA